MKKIFIFGTKLRMFLCELPLIFIMAVSIYFNPDMKTPGKLYPLIIAMAAGIIFMFIYLFRGVSISGEKIKSVGLFSSRDSIVVEKNKEFYGENFILSDALDHTMPLSDIALIFINSPPHHFKIHKIVYLNISERSFIFCPSDITTTLSPAKI